MSEIKLPFPAEIIHDLPNDISLAVGKVIVSFAKLEHKLGSLSGLLLQLNKAESRIALRSPRAVDRLDMALDLFAIKDIYPKSDTKSLREVVQAASSGRDIVGHGLWLQHPETGELYIQLTRGKWPKNMTKGDSISRAVYPQSIPYGADNCNETLALIEKALSGVDELGAEIDAALQAYPERFREPAPLLNPLGSRTPVRQ